MIHSPPSPSSRIPMQSDDFPVCCFSSSDCRLFGVNLFGRKRGGDIPVKRHSFDNRLTLPNVNILENGDVWGFYTREINEVSQQCIQHCNAVDIGQTGPSGTQVLNPFTIPQGKLLTGSSSKAITVKDGRLFRFSKDLVENDFCCCDQEVCICNNLDGQVSSVVRSQGGIELFC